MDRHTERRGSKPQVLIAGGGVAAVEAMLALRDLAAEQGEIELHARRRNFRYRPLVLGEPFAPVRLLEFDLEGLAEQVGARFCLNSVIGVDSRRQRVITHDRSEVAYDHLLLCVGARKLASIWGADTFWGVNDEGGVVAVLGRLRRGELHRLVFAITAASWPLPLYELALLAEAELTQLGRKEDVTLTIVTPEDAPLGLFGVGVGERLRELLAERGIELLTGTYPVKVEGGFLQITPGDVLAADAVISTPRLEGHRLEGVPTNASGFVEVDEFSRVVDLEHVYAAGDMTAFPVKQGGIATQQADVAAEAIAAELGVNLSPRPFDPALRATLRTGEAPRYLYGKLAGGFGETSTFSDHAIWEPEGKIIGRYLTSFLNTKAKSTPGSAGH